MASRRIGRRRRIGFLLEVGVKNTREATAGWQPVDFTRPGRMRPGLRDFRRSVQQRENSADSYHGGSHIFHARLAKKLRSLFGRCGVDVETGSPFKSRRLG